MDSPVLIGGVNRSGTSLARQLLGSHPELAIPPTEFEFLRRLGRTRRPSVDDVLAWPKVTLWGVDPEHVRALAGGARSARSVYVAFLRAYADKLGRPRFGEKTTHLERHVRRLDRWFGRDYAFVHMLRHPVAAYASARWYGGRERRFDVRRWADAWSESVATALDGRGARHVPLRYEDLVSDPVRELRRVCSLVRLDYDARMLEMADFEEIENSSFALRDAVYAGRIRTADAVDRAQRVPPEELAVIKRRCRAAAAAAGYRLDDPALAPSGALGRADRALRLRAFARRRLRGVAGA